MLPSSAFLLTLSLAAPAVSLGGPMGGQATDTLVLPTARAAADPAGPLAAATIIVPSDEDRMMGSLPDLLQRVAGVHVVRAGGFGDYVGVYIHGSSDRQVNVYVDGVPQDPASHPGAFLGERDLALVERIEVYKGLAPDHLTGSPMGGAINIVTRGLPRGHHVEGAAGAGSFGAYKASGRAGLRGGTVNFSAQVTHNRAEGNFPYYDDDGTEFQFGRHPDGAPRSGADDLVRKVRRNNAHAFSEVAADLAWAPASLWRLESRIAASTLGKEVPTSFASVDSTVTVSAFRENLRASWRGSATREAAGRSSGLTLSAAHQEEDYTDTSAAGGAVGTGYDMDRNRYLDLTATFTDRWAPAPGLVLASLASYSLAGYRYTDRHEDRVRPWILRYAGEGKLAPTYALGRHVFQGSLSAVLHLQEHAGEVYSLRGRRLPNEEWGRLGAWRLGYQYSPRPWLRLTVHGGRAYRLPSFEEKFGDRGLSVGSPGLKPEEGYNAVAGVHLDGARASLDLRGFASHGRNIITLVPNSQKVLLYGNTGSTRILGLEASGQTRWGRWSRTEADVTMQQALNLDGGTRVDDAKLIPFRPLAQTSLRQSFLKGGWALTAAGYWQGRTEANPSNGPSIFNSYSHTSAWQTRVDLRLSWRGEYLLAAAGMDNAFDQRNFDFFNLPLPGRSLSASLHAGF